MPACPLLPLIDHPPAEPTDQEPPWSQPPNKQTNNTHATNPPQPHDIPLKGPSPNPAKAAARSFSLGSFDWNPLDLPLPTLPPLPGAEWVIRCILLGSSQLSLEDPEAVAGNVKLLLQSLAGYQGDVTVDLSRWVQRVMEWVGGWVDGCSMLCRAGPPGLALACMYVHL